MKLHGVESIPSSLVTCFVQGMEVRIVELAYEGFSFRVAKKRGEVKDITLNFLQFEQSSYHSVVLEDFNIECEEYSFYVLYTVMTSQPEYVTYAKEIIQKYGQYISLKLSGDDGYLSEVMVGYSAEEDESYYKTWEEQKKDWFGSLNFTDMPVEVENTYELALSIDNPRWYNEYLSMGLCKFQQKYLEENHLSEHPLFRKPTKRLYIGNQFCHNLLPEEDQLILLMNKARAEGLEITLVFTYLRDEFVEQTTTLLKSILEWCQLKQQAIEVVVNDWGMIQILWEFNEQKSWEYLHINLGVLLNKRRKDPRYTYKRGFSKNVDKLSKNNLNGAIYRSYLREKWHITRFEYEVCPMCKNEDSKEDGVIPFQVAGNHNSLHLPYYQTNTSQYCTLYAKCTTGDRGNQKLVRNCPRYCEEEVFLYPKHLHMVGRYNSLFGYDETLLKEPEKLSQYLEQGIDRIVLTLL